MAENLKIIFISIGIFCAKFQVMPVIKCKDGREKMNKRATTGMEIFIPQCWQPPFLLAKSQKNKYNRIKVKWSIVFDIEGE